MVDNARFIMSISGCGIWGVFIIMGVGETEQRRDILCK
jgi:hypothetical protein